MRKIILIALLLIVSGCETASNLRSRPQQTTKADSGYSSTEDKQTLIHQFENDIAIKLLGRIKSKPLAIIPTEESLRQQVELLEEVAGQMSALDDSLLDETNRQLVHQVNMLRISRQTQLENWPLSNHLNLLRELLPPITLEKITPAELDTFTRHLINTPTELTRLQTNLKQQRLVVRYPADLITNQLDYIRKLGDPDNSPLINRYKQALAYSTLDVEQQRESFREFIVTFDESIYPAYVALADYLTELSATQNRLDLPLAGRSNTLPGNPDDLLTTLQAAVISTEEQITSLMTKKINTTSSLKELYEDAQYSLKNHPDTFQAVLNLLFLHVSNVQPGLSEWFFRKPSNEIILAANEYSILAPFKYADGVALFDLDILSDLPGFELETIIYKYSAPGYHMLAPSLLSGRDDLMKVYSEGWANYAMSIPFDQGYVLDDLSKLGYLVHLQLIQCKAISDIRLLLKDWTVQQAANYIARYTPYATTQIDREVNWVSANPGIAIKSLMISIELHNLNNYGLSELRLPLRVFHQTILSHSPATLRFLRSNMRDILKEQSQPSS